MTATRPSRLVVCFGTATEIGKTWVGAATLQALRRAGRTVAARKPAQSFDPTDPQPTDAELLGGASAEPATAVCPNRWVYPIPLAPPMAATTLGRPAPGIDEQVAWLEASWPAGPVDIGWVETVGGPRSPIAADGDGVTLASRLRPDHLVLVADSALGTINAVRLCTQALASIAGPGHQPPPLTVIVNRFDPADHLHVDNVAWLREHDGCDLVTNTSDLARHLVR